MRIILLAICLLPSTFLLSQNPQNYPPPLPDYGQQSMLDSETILNDPLSFGQPAFSQMSNQRIAQVGQSDTNENERLIYDSLIWEVYNEEKDVWELSSINKYTRDVHGNVTTWLYQLYDGDSEAWVNQSKYEKVYNENHLETSYIRSNWNSDKESWINEKKILQDYDESGRIVFYEFYIWNNDREDWEGSLKDGRGYNDAGSLTLYTRFSDWDWEKGWIDGYKSEYTFNEDNLVTEELRFYYDSETESWENKSKQESSYSDKGLIELFIHSDWDTELEDWIGNFKREYQYDLNDSLDTELVYYWSEESFILEDKSEYSYDKEQEKVQIKSRWQVDEWVVLSKTVSVYNEQKQLLSSRTYSHKTVDEIDTWIIDYETEYQRDSKGQLLHYEHLNWDVEGNIILQGDRTIRSYNKDGFYTLNEHYDWDVDKQLWYGTRATHTSFGQNNHILDEKKYNDWDFETNSWIGENRYTYEVNDHNKRLSSDYYNWIDGDWKHTYRSNYYFHLDCTSSSTPVANYIELDDQIDLCSVESLEAPTAIGCGGHLLATTDAEFPIETVGTHEVIWIYDDGNGNTSTQTQKVIIDQSCQPLSVEDLSSLIEVYPNPSLGQINFKKQIDDLKIYNQKGQLEMHIKSPGASINVSRLKAGVYYLSLEHQSKTSRVKILKN